MSIDIKTPQLPESVNDATVITWHKQPGDTVHEDENLVDLETDKVVLEVPSPARGVLERIQQPEGAKVTSGAVLGTLDTEIGAKETPAPAAEQPVPGKSSTTHSDPASTSPAQETPFASPSVRQKLHENALTEQDVTPTGDKGHITTDDVMRELATRPQSSDLIGGREERRVPMTRLRARMAERLTQAQQTTATLTTFNEIDMQAVMDLRNRYKAVFEQTHQVRLGFMSFFIRAVCEALKRFPDVNASVDGTDIIYHGYFDIGVAVSSDRGLVVPIIRDADQLSTAEIEQQIVALSKKARSGKLTMDDLTGGTFTVSNGGVFGSMLSTPIINPPQAGILGMHKIEKRPVVVDDSIVIRPVMYVALSYDHRLIDGKTAVQFLVTVKQLIEDPGRLLLGV